MGTTEIMHTCVEKKCPFLYGIPVIALLGNFIVGGGGGGSLLKSECRAVFCKGKN